MKKYILNCLMILTLFCSGLFLLTACGETKYDFSKLVVEDATYTYDGNIKSINISGVPEGVTANISYYSDEQLTNVVAGPTDADTYFAKVTFEDAKGKTVGEEKTATLTINKANFNSVDVNVMVSYEVNEIDEQTQQPKKVTKTIPANKDVDGTYYVEWDREIFDYTVKVTGYTADGVTVTGTTNYYNDIKADGTFDSANSVQLNPRLESPILGEPDFGEKIYMQVRVEDKNHNPLTVTKVLSSERRLKREIKTYADLCAMRDDANLPIEAYSDKGTPANPTEKCRRQYRWVLRNNIDCGGEVWKTIGSPYFMDAAAANDIYFAGEFDGNGYTISNFKLTNDSVSDINSKNGVRIGFFGSASSAYIHDVTFENVELKVDTKATDKTDAYVWNGKNPVMAGIVVGNVGTAVNRVQMKNITVKNCTINVDAYKAAVGAVVGSEEFNYNGGTPVRENINVENVKIFATNHSEHQSQRVSIGAFAGEVTEAGQMEPILNYKNCTVKNVEIGYDYKSWNTEKENTNEVYNKYNNPEGFTGYYVAAFTAYVRAPITFTNCVLENYTIATNGKTGYCSFVKSDPLITITLENCTQNKGTGEFAGVWFNGFERTDTENINWTGTVQD